MEQVRDTLHEACETWRHHIGPPPPHDSPLAGVFGAGMRHVEHLLADILGVEEYEAGEPGGDGDDELRGTLANILAAAGVAIPAKDASDEGDGWPGPDVPARS